MGLVARKVSLTLKKTKGGQIHCRLLVESLGCSPCRRLRSGYAQFFLLLSPSSVRIQATPHGSDVDLYVAANNDILYFEDRIPQLTKLMASVSNLNVCSSSIGFTQSVAQFVVSTNTNGEAGSTVVLGDNLSAGGRKLLHGLLVDPTSFQPLINWTRRRKHPHSRSLCRRLPQTRPRTGFRAIGRFRSIR
ncbi:unnamed protein product [Mesocestoides corti]|uniref:Uncharacterized protein n=1 Tax=Mesocestoides corti TaxID=53468 RepID=A0A0R3UCB2_MESCO|nr:unnamed protein product [Mesocestoides corti]